MHGVVVEEGEECEQDVQKTQLERVRLNGRCDRVSDIPGMQVAGRWVRWPCKVDTLAKAEKKEWSRQHTVVWKRCTSALLTDRVEVHHDELGAGRIELGVKLVGRRDLLDHPVRCAPQREGRASV